jgi:quercetin dioxygenase-like cupin family protein
MAAHPIPNAAQEDIVQFSLEQEMADSERRRPWQSGVLSKTLFKSSDMRVLLVCMDQDATMDDHHADGSISIQVLNGCIRCRVNGHSRELSQRDVLTLQPSIRHAVKAVEASAFLLTISWPSSQKLESLEHRGYGS